jgi:hypothetical protein
VKDVLDGSGHTCNCSVDHKLQMMTMTSPCIGVDMKSSPNSVDNFRVDGVNWKYETVRKEEEGGRN